MLPNKIITKKFLYFITMLLLSVFIHNSDNKDNNTAIVTSKECCICFFSGFCPCCSNPALYSSIKEIETSTQNKILALQEHMQQESSKNQEALNQLEKEVISLKKTIAPKEFSISPDQKISRENNLQSFQLEEKSDH